MFSRLSLGVTGLASSTLHASDDSAPDPKDSGAHAEHPEDERKHTKIRREERISSVGLGVVPVL